MIINHLGVVLKLMFFLCTGFSSFGLQQAQMALRSECFTRLDGGVSALQRERWETET